MSLRNNGGKAASCKPNSQIIDLTANEDPPAHSLASQEKYFSTTSKPSSTPNKTQSKREPAFSNTCEPIFIPDEADCLPEKGSSISSSSTSSSDRDKSKSEGKNIFVAIEALSAGSRNDKIKSNLKTSPSTEYKYATSSNYKTKSDCAKMSSINSGSSASSFDKTKFDCAKMSDINSGSAFSSFDKTKSDREIVSCITSRSTNSSCEKMKSKRENGPSLTWGSPCSNNMQAKTSKPPLRVIRPKPLYAWGVSPAAGQTNWLNLTAGQSTQVPNVTPAYLNLPAPPPYPGHRLFEDPIGKSKSVSGDFDSVKLAVHSITHPMGAGGLYPKSLITSAGNDRLRVGNYFQSSVAFPQYSAQPTELNERAQSDKNLFCSRAQGLVEINAPWNTDNGKDDPSKALAPCAGGDRLPLGQSLSSRRSSLESSETYRPKFTNWKSNTACWFADRPTQSMVDLYRQWKNTTTTEYSHPKRLNFLEVDDMEETTHNNSKLESSERREESSDNSHADEFLSQCLNSAAKVFNIKPNSGGFSQMLTNKPETTWSLPAMPKTSAPVQNFSPRPYTSQTKEQCQGGNISANKCNKNIKEDINHSCRFFPEGPMRLPVKLPPSLGEHNLGSESKTSESDPAKPQSSHQINQNFVQPLETSCFASSTPNTTNSFDESRQPQRVISPPVVILCESEPSNGPDLTFNDKNCRKRCRERQMMPTNIQKRRYFESTGTDALYPNQNVNRPSVDIPRRALPAAPLLLRSSIPSSAPIVLKGFQCQVRKEPITLYTYALDPIVIPNQVQDCSNDQPTNSMHVPTANIDHKGTGGKNRPEIRPNAADPLMPFEVFSKGMHWDAKCTSPI